MQLTPQAQAILLLTVNFSKADKDGAKPLSNGEWGRFATLLRDKGLTPADLLSADDALLGQFSDRTLTEPRIKSLLGRGAALGFALEKWERAGLWALTRGDADYPDRLKRRLRAASPPVLFGCGNMALLGKGGLAVVGSRNASEDDLAFATRLGEHASVAGLSIVSGGARGIDDAAMTGALDNEGTGVAVLADSLLRTATSARFRRALLAGDLVLISPFNPEAGFFAGNAMARNKYIYCLSEAAVVVSSTPSKGGTWSGAVEAIKQDWVPVWIKQTEDTQSGNPKLVDQGARWLPDPLGSADSLMRRDTIAVDEPRLDLLAMQDLRSRPFVIVEGKDQRLEESAEAAIWTPAPEAQKPSPLDQFLSALRGIPDAPSAKEISARLLMKKADVYRLLKQGVEQGSIEKLSKPVRYRLMLNRAEQTSFL